MNDVCFYHPFNKLQRNLKEISATPYIFWYDGKIINCRHAQRSTVRVYYYEAVYSRKCRAADVDPYQRPYDVNSVCTNIS